MSEEIIKVKHLIAPSCLVEGVLWCQEKGKCYYDLNLDEMEFDSEEELKSVLDKVNIKRIAGEFETVQKVRYVWGEISTIEHDGKFYINENWRNYDVVQPKTKI